ncbi:hypothetical protein GCM10022377_21080 [Zhihengliuella alba]|uniref:Lipoprotein n=1 Tax=Zhihengliuella alba TaxID=547018 RepID=A0ABP7DRS8_9MICC
MTRGTAARTRPAKRERAARTAGTGLLGPALATAAALLLAGCSAGAPDESPGTEAGPPASADAPVGTADPLTGMDVGDASDAQAAEIDDRAATAEEYEAAFQRYRTCLSEAGVELSVADSDGPLRVYSVPGTAVDSGVDGDCYRAEFQYTDMLWQSTDTVQDSAQATSLLRECLQDHGIEPADTRDELDAQLRGADLEIMDCFD